MKQTIKEINKIIEAYETIRSIRYFTTDTDEEITSSIIEDIEDVLFTFKTWEERELIIENIIDIGWRIYFTDWANATKEKENETKKEK